MNNIKIPKGTIDFFPEEVKKRTLIIKIIIKNFEDFGFDPIETPSFEDLSILTGKYGQEGDKLIFKILKLGDFMKSFLSIFDIKKSKKDILEYLNYKNIISYISDKALRYDLTVPLARFIVMYKDQIIFPFKRYQIQKVWRGDKPQKGRFREFSQCDADIIGTPSLWQEIELIQLSDSIFKELKLPITIHINNIKLLYNLFNKLNLNSYWKTFITLLEKWEKIGSNKVFKEMVKNGIPLKIIQKLNFIFNEENFEKKIYKFYKICYSDQEKKSINDIKFIFYNLKKLGLKKSELVFTPRLGRGLNYYTGIIFEIFSPYFQNAIGGGGRYDNLTSLFGLKTTMSGSGISLGLDRIYLIMNKFHFFDNIINLLTILFLNFGNKESIYALHYIQILIKNGITSEFYPSPIKIKKQLHYANIIKLRFIAIIGKKEREKKHICIKDLKTGIETYHHIKSIVENFKK